MEIHFEIENKCLLSCRHCSSGASLEGIEFDYAVEQMLDFLSAITEEKLVFFTGGEPLLNRNFDNLLRSIKKMDRTLVGIFTSGVIDSDGAMTPVSKTQAKRLAELGLKICCFSIYSPDPEVHDWMTNTKGSYSNSCKSIENLRNAGIEIRFNTVVAKINKDCIEEIIQTACVLGAAEVRLLKLIEHGRACRCWNEIGIDENEYRSIVKDVLSEKHAVRITVSGAADLIACRPVDNAQACQAGSRLLYVTFNGDIFPCASVKNNTLFCIGNIRDKKAWLQYLADKKSYGGAPLCMGKGYNGISDLNLRKRMEN